LSTDFPGVPRGDGLDRRPDAALVHAFFKETGKVRSSAGRSLLR
jgi:hypothetical protein